METSNIGSHGNLFLEDYQNVSADTKLLPFRNTTGTFLTFNDCRNTTTLGYAYPETQHWNFASDEAYQSDVTSTIANLYGGRTRSQAHLQVVTQIVTAFGQILLDNNNTYTEWMIETQAIASKLPPTFIVSFSLAGMSQFDPIVDIGNWMMLMPERINDVHTQDTPSVPERMTNGATSITTHLVDRINAGQLGSLDPNDVVLYLSEHLTWNVYDVSLSTSMATTVADLCRNAVNVFHSQIPKSLR
jgi:tyrosinase